MEKFPQSSYTIRFNDCDPFGHLNNSKYIDYFINAREDHLRDAYGIDLKKWAQQGIGFVVSQHEIRYIRPVSYTDVVVIRSVLIGWGDSWLQVEMAMFDETGLHLKAILWSVFTRINLKTGKRETHPEDFLGFRGVLVEVEKGLGERVEGMRNG